MQSETDLGGVVNFTRGVSGGALFIGCGGSGTEVIRRIQRLLSKSSTVGQEDKPYHFLTVDTDERNKQGLGDATFAYVGGFVPEELIKFQGKKVKSWWWNSKSKTPWLSHLPRVEDGAGQIRLLGRLGFYKGVSRISSSIRASISELTNYLNNLKRGNPNTSIKVDVFIIGSFGGGTGSSMYNDIAAVVHKELKDVGIQQPLVVGIFITGDAFAKYVITPPALKMRAKANTFASLAEYFYDKASGIDSPARLRPRLNPLSRDDMNPLYIEPANFTNLILMQGTNEIAATATNIDSLYDIVAYSLATVANNYGRVAAAGKNISSIFGVVNISLPDILSSMGAYSVYYPNDVVTNYAVKNVALKVIQRYLYNNNDNRHEAEEDNIKQAVDKFLKNKNLTVDGTYKLLDDLVFSKHRGLKNMFTDFSGTLEQDKPAEEIYQDIVRRTDRALELIKSELDLLFKNGVDDTGKEILSLSEKIAKDVIDELNAIYRQKDFGYLEGFVNTLVKKLEGLRNTFGQKREDNTASSDKNAKEEVQKVLNSYSGRFLANLKQKKYLKTEGKSKLVSYYNEQLRYYIYKAAERIISDLLDEKLQNSIKTYADVVKDFTQSVKNFSDPLSSEIINFEDYFDHTKQITTTEMSILYAKEIINLVRKYIPEKDDKMFDNIYASICDNEIFDSFYKNLKEAGNEATKVDIRKEVGNKILAVIKKALKNELSTLFNLDMYDAVEKLHGEDNTKKTIQKRIEDVFMKVRPFINVSDAIRNPDAISLNAYLSLPPSKDDPSKVEQKWIEISKHPINSLNTKLSGEVQIVPSINGQTITLSILESGISPQSITMWDEWKNSYRYFMGTNGGTWSRPDNVVPVLADRLVEDSLEKIVQIMEKGSFAATKQESILEHLALGYAFGYIVENQDDHTCYVKLLHNLDAQYWKKFVEEVIGEDGKKYFKFTPPGEAGDNLYELFKYLSGDLSAESGLIKEIERTVSAVVSNMNRLDVKEKVKEVSKELSGKIKSIPLIDSEINTHRKTIYTQMKKILDDYYSFS